MISVILGQLVIVLSVAGLIVYIIGMLGTYSIFQDLTKNEFILIPLALIWPVPILICMIIGTLTNWGEK